MWRDWLHYQLLTPVLGTPTAELGYEELFAILPQERKEAFMRKRRYFKEKSKEEAGDKAVWTT